MNVLAVWYSRRGATTRLVDLAAALLHQAGHRVDRCRLETRRQHSYAAWLALSFLPGSRAALQCPHPSPEGYDACLLACPKWAFSCPPINAYLAGDGARLPPTALLVSCGGWDQERYLRALERRVARAGGPVLGGLAVREDQAGSPDAQRRLRDFLDRCCARVAPPDAPAPEGFRDSPAGPGRPS